MSNSLNNIKVRIFRRNYKKMQKKIKIESKYASHCRTLNAWEAFPSLLRAALSSLPSTFWLLCLFLFALFLSLSLYLFFSLVWCVSGGILSLPLSLIRLSLSLSHSLWQALNTGAGRLSKWLLGGLTGLMVSSSLVTNQN